MDQKKKIPSKVVYYSSLFGLVTLVFHLYTNTFGGYGIFRDELYYIACSKRLDLGYVDHPPLSIYLLYLNRLIFGDSVFSIRLLPAIISALTVYITGLLTFRIGGHAVAIIIACTAVTFAPLFLAMNTIYSMNTFDYLLWVLAAYFIVMLVKYGDKKYWYYIGISAGLGLLNKIGFLWFGAGLFIGILLTMPRAFLKKDIYLAGFIALLIFSPYIIWNLFHDMAHLEFINNATQYKYAGVTRIDFLLGQILQFNPIVFPVWLAGILFYFFNKEGKSFRILGIIYLVSFLVLIIKGQTKPEYLGPIYPVLLTGGAVSIQGLCSRKVFTFMKYLTPALIGITGIFLMPMFLPVLPLQTYLKYQGKFNIQPPSAEGKRLNQLPQFYADMFGWENMAKTVSEVYMTLSPEEQRKTIIFAHNYGEAGAVEYFSDKYENAPVVSPHNSYWYWIDEVDSDCETIIVIGGDIKDHLASCEFVKEAAIIAHPYSMPYESDLPVYICRKLKRDLFEIWDESKTFI